MTGLMVLLALLAAEVPNGRPVGESPSFSFVDSTSQTVVRALEAAMLLSDQEGGDLRLAVWSGQFEGPGGEPGVLMVVEVDGPALLSGAVSDDLIVDLHVYALKEEHQIDAAISRRVDIELKEHRRLLETGGLKLPVFLPLPAGNHHLRLLATTGPESFGVRSLQVSVIADSSAEPSARPPVFPDRSDGWLVALPAVQGEGETDPWPPFLSRQSETLPSALPVLHRGERPRGFVYVPSSNRLDRLQVVLRPSFADTVVRLSVAPLRRRQSGSPHLEIVEFELPEIDLPSGIYTGIVELEPEMEDGPSTKSFNLVVSDLVEALHWPQLDLETGSPPDEEAVAAISLQPATGLPQREIVEGYRLVVLRLAEGHEEEALELLSTLEQQSLRPGEQASMSRLETSQERVSQSLSNQGVELLPLLLLHTRAALNYRTRGQFVLSRHSLRLVRHLARFTDPTAEHSEAAPATAGLLIMLADSEAEYGNLPQALSLYGEALDLGWHVSRGQLGIATVLERQGRYAETIEILRQLLQSQPDHPEARLRLGINLARKNQLKRAQPVLEQLATEDGAAWISSLARQELARLEARQRRPEDAMEILQEGLAKAPGDFTLRVQLAYLYDQNGAPGRARELLGQLPEGVTGSGRRSARWFYHRPPAPDGESELERFAEEAQSWLPALRDALEPAGTTVSRR